MSYRTPPLTNGHAPKQRAANAAEMKFISRHGVEAFENLPEHDRAELAENLNGHRQNPNEPDGKPSFVNVDAQCIQKFEPFPVESLPQPVRAFVEAGALAIGCDPSFLAVPTLVAMAAAIGNSWRVILKRGWTEPPIIWAALVAYSGDHKSPAIEQALRALRELQRRKLREFEAEYTRWLEHELAQYEHDLASFKKSKGGGTPPAKPEEPVAWRALVDDTTIEALASLLQKQPRGLLLACDELASWLGGFDKYKTKGGSDAAKWLEVHGGRMLLIDRKSGQPKTLCIPNASVSVVGGIQPSILRQCLTAEHRANGLSARLLVAYPPRRAKRWSEAEVSPALEKAIGDVVDRLLTLEMEIVEGDTDPRPKLAHLDPDAKRLFVRFYNEHADEQSAMTGELCATWSKLEAYAPRLALVHHFIRWANGEIPPERESQIDASSMQAGITLANWFGGEARRVHGLLSETDDQREQRELVEWIQRRGGSTSVRDMMRHQWRYRNSSDKAQADLSALVKAGFGLFVQIPPGEQGGRPTEAFQISDLLAHRHRHNPEPNGVDDGFVDAPSEEVKVGERYFTPGELDEVDQVFPTDAYREPGGEG